MIGDAYLSVLTLVADERCLVAGPGHGLVMLGNENVARAHHLSGRLALITNNFLRAFYLSRTGWAGFWPFIR